MASVSQIRSLFIKIQQATDESSYRKAREKANKYINSLTNEDIEKLKESDKLEVFGSGDEFKANLLEQIGAKSNKDFNDKDKNPDESIFTKSMKEIEDTDLSQDAINKALENPESEDAQFYQMLDTLYNDEMLKGIIDGDSDGEITNEEAQNFIKNLNVDKDKKNFSLNDLTTFFDKMNGIVDYTNLNDKEAEKLAKEKGQAGEKTKTGGITKNPYVSSSKANSWSSGTSANIPTTPTPTEQKDDLKSQIETIKQEISTIEQNSKNQIQAEKENLNEVLKNEKDENLEQVLNITDDIAQKNEQLTQTTAQIASLDVDINSKTSEKSSLEGALSSLTTPQGADDNTVSKIEQRKTELSSQISQLDSEIAALEQQKAQLEAQKQELESAIQESQTQKDELSVNFSNESKEALSNYDKNLADIQSNTENQIKTKESQIADLQVKLDKTEDTIQENENTKAQSTFSADFEEMINTIIDQFEGGLANDPDDNGGLTKYGITAATYQSYTGNKNADVSKITLEKAKEIYYNNYYLGSGADKYVKMGNNAYAFALLDASINHGVPTAQKWDKKANGDIDSFMELRKTKYENIIKNNEKQRKFKKGWETRYNTVYNYIDPTHKQEKFSC